MTAKEILPTQEQFDAISDLRLYLRQSIHDRTQDCLHYLGDRAQIWHNNNGWNTYRMEYDNYEKRHVIPPFADKYLICRKDGKVHFAQYDGAGFNTGLTYDDSTIIGWQEIPKAPKQR